MLTRLSEARKRAKQREQVEEQIPKHLLYIRGWPTIMPTFQEALLLSRIRRTVAEIMQIPIAYTEPESILARYAQLMAIHTSKGGRQLNPVEIGPIQQSLWNTAIGS